MKKLRWLSLLCFVSFVFAEKPANTSKPTVASRLTKAQLDSLQSLGTRFLSACHVAAITDQADEWGTELRKLAGCGPGYANPSADTWKALGLKPKGITLVSADKDRLEAFRSAFEACGFHPKTVNPPPANLIIDKVRVSFEYGDVLVLVGDDVSLPSP